MTTIIPIAAGGAIGAVARHLLSQRIALALGLVFPFGTLAVNVLGSFLMGLLVTLFALKFSPTRELSAFLTVGLLGGFTTFSAFSMEVVLLYERHTFGLAAVYAGASIALAVTGLFAGMFAAKALA